jgi:hypothetical protein
MQIRFPPRIRVQRPTVIALASWGTQTADSVFIPFRAVAEKLGFDFAVAAGPRAIIVDVPSNAVHHVPEDVSVGFVLLIPARRPKLIRGPIDPEHLEAAIRAYPVAVRSLAF